MKPINNFKANTSASYEKLPAGNYPGVILGAKVESGQYGDTLVIQAEISGGEYIGYFKKDFDAQANSQYGQKYKGVLRVNLPSGDGSEYDGYKVKALERIAGALELSNAGYTWDWDEKKLKNKACGLMVREHIKCFDDGREASWTEIASLCDINKYNEVPKLKPKDDRTKKKATATAETKVANEVEDDELPF